MSISPSDHEAVLADRSTGALSYQGHEHWVRIAGVSPEEIDGDVLLVIPHRGIAQRLIRARSNHNSLLVTERCDQLCVMCSQPPKKHHHDLFEYLTQASLLAPLNAAITITGGEPTLFKSQLFDFLCGVLAKRPDIRFHVLTNGQHFEPTDAHALAKLRGSVSWGIPIYDSDAAGHDAMVGKLGAFDRLMESFATLALVGAPIELRTVVMNPNAARLEMLADFISVQVPFAASWALMQLENIGYGRQNWMQLFFDSSENFEPIGAAIDVFRARGLVPKLYNFPLCTVPTAYRGLAVASISDWKRRYLSECAGCSQRVNCTGFFEWQPKQGGFKSIGFR